MSKEKFVPKNFVPANSIRKVNNLCKSVLKLTDEDFSAVKEMAYNQAGFTHPLKHKKQREIHAMSDHNFRVIEALENLRNVIRAGAPENR